MSSVTILVMPPSLAILVVLVGCLIMLVVFDTFNFIAITVGVTIAAIGFWRLALKVRQLLHRH